MRTLFLNIFAGILLSILATGFIASYIMVSRMDEELSRNPPEGFRAVAEVMVRTLSRISPADLENEIQALSKDWNMSMVLVEPDGDEADSMPICDGEEICWSLSLFHGSQAREGVILARLPNTDRILKLGPFELVSPWNLTAMLLVVVTILVVAGFTGFHLSAPVVRKLKELETAAVHLEQGNLSARAQVSGSDTVGVLAARFNKMADKLQELIEGQIHMVQAVSHELRTPIARIRFGLEMMSSAETEDERFAREEQIQAELEELDKLIEELLLMIRYEARARELSRSRFNPVETVRSLVERSRPLVEGKEIVLDAPDSPLELEANPRSFERVLQNLLSNAGRYAVSKVAIKLAREPSGLSLEISDDGPGIPADKRTQVLEPFFRLDKSRSRDSGGVGLGLSIVARIMAAHGGTISIEDSDLGGVAVKTVWPMEGSGASLEKVRRGRGRVPSS